jgi:GNAT superfamily N-acetyltransferase
MHATAYTDQGRFELRRPENETEWDRYHSIRERALWDGLKLTELGVPPYSRDGANGRADSVHPLVCLRNGIVCATLGLDPVCDSVIEVRAVAVEPACQRRGYGSVMLALAERAASKDGFARAIVHGHSQVIPFYARNGYRHETTEGIDLSVFPAAPMGGGVWMGKRLDLGVAQNPPSVFIAAA